MNGHVRGENQQLKNVLFATVFFLNLEFISDILTLGDGT